MGSAQTKLRSIQMGVRVRRKVIRRPRDEEDVEEEKVSKKVVEEDAGDELDEVPEQIKKIAKDEEEDIPAIFRNPIAKKVVVPPPVARKIVPPSKKVVEEEEEELPVEPKPVKDFETKTVNDVVLDNLFVRVMEHLGMGQELVIFKVSGDKWTVKIPGAVEEPKVLRMPPSKREEFEAKGYMTKAKSPGKLSGKEYEQEVCTQEYLDFVEDWRGMDITEKRKLAKSLKVTWNKAADEKIENMSLSRAVQEAKEITKYKPKYKSGAARASVKG
jgi:hypothetical protein